MNIIRSPLVEPGRWAEKSRPSKALRRTIGVVSENRWPHKRRFNMTEVTLPIIKTATASDEARVIDSSFREI